MDTRRSRHELLFVDGPNPCAIVKASLAVFSIMGGDLINMLVSDVTGSGLRPLRTKFQHHRQQQPAFQSLNFVAGRLVAEADAAAPSGLGSSRRICPPGMRKYERKFEFKLN